LQIRIDRPIAGHLAIASKSSLERTVTARIQVDLTSYTGLVIAHVYLFEELLILKPKQSETVMFSVPADCLRDMFTEDWDITITALARVLHTDERFYTQQVLTLLKPTLSIKKVHFSNLAFAIV
uniref:AraC family transcriptional regulator n=1 Tax=Gongylonema pulchrum TaxID=637853 RepID=A0A183DK41_9BILA